METIEAKNTISKMKAAWPNMYAPNDGERISLYVNAIIGYDFHFCSNKVEKLINTRRNYPSVSELLEYLDIDEKPKFNISSSCNICDNTGWQFIDDVGHGTVVKCSCGKLD